MSERGGRTDPLLIRRMRDTAKEAGLAGKDPFSKHTEALIAATAAILARGPVGAPRRDWWVAVIVAGTMLLSAAAAAYGGYLWGRGSIITDGDTRCFILKPPLYWEKGK